ncbi:MAG TPA: hypothetical protein VGZ23_14510 [bacterium]|nr:hypothetical protein [bacterium]
MFVDTPDAIRSEPLERTACSAPLLQLDQLDAFVGVLWALTLEPVGTAGAV